MDTDSSGNIWFDFSTSAAGDKGYGGLGEVTNPTTSPSVRIVLPAGTYGFPGGVYVSCHGSVLEVTDQESRETYQYRLPVTKMSEPFNVLGPTETKYGVGNPVSGGFNKAETAFALADLKWIDTRGRSRPKVTARTALASELRSRRPINRGGRHHFLSVPSAKPPWYLLPARACFKRRYFLLRCVREMSRVRAPSATRGWHVAAPCSRPRACWGGVPAA